MHCVSLIFLVLWFLAVQLTFWRKWYIYSFARLYCYIPELVINNYRYVSDYCHSMIIMTILSAVVLDTYEN